MGHIVVIGDAIVESDIEGRVDRLCTDAPVHVVDVERVRSRPGGAALAAIVAGRAGDGVVLISGVANDAAGALLAKTVEDRGVTLIALECGGQTTEVRRVRSSDRSLLQLEFGEAGAIGGLTRRAVKALSTADAILVADFGRGLAGLAELRWLLNERVPRIPIVWDPHRLGPPPVPGMSLVIPSEGHAREISAGRTPLGAAGVSTLGFSLLQRWCAEAVAINRGPPGAMLFSGEACPVAVSPPRGHPAAADAAGAGACFAGAAVAAMARHASVVEAVQHAVDCAARFVDCGGAPSLFDGPSPRPDPPRTIVTIEEAAGIASRMRAKGLTVVATSSCFDRLRRSDIETLRTARSHGDTLFVILHNGEALRALNGIDRQDETDCAAVLAELECVNHVVLCNGDTPTTALRRIMPQLFVTGPAAHNPPPEVAFVHEWAGHVVMTPERTGQLA